MIWSEKAVCKRKGRHEGQINIWYVYSGRSLPETNVHTKVRRNKDAQLGSL